MVLGLSFSNRAQLYYNVRPFYPAEIFAVFSALTPACDLCWDAGTGNGQAAFGAAKYYRQVIATDLSVEQMEYCHEAGNIEYKIAGVEAPFIESAAADLVIAACAAHWLDRAKFYAEAERVLKPGGILSVWSYYHPLLGSEIDAEIEHYYHRLCGPLVPAEHNQYMDFYASLEFPDWEQIRAPVESICLEWTLEQLLGFMGTFSTRVEFEKINQIDPLEIVRGSIAAKWGDPDNLRPVFLPLGFRTGRKPKN